ncbi:glycosyltransferase [Paraconexibacter sp.]|uniref:glycosyltransferase n=1 Tax=Paraconexibacter sp. TaxID=2949640 RepID=UPI0035679C56
MALRLTTVPADAPAQGIALPAVPSSRTTPASVLGPRAAQALARRDVPAYRALFAEAAAVDDVHRRWQARKALVQAGLGVQGTALGVVAPVFAAVADACLELLEQDPREPQLLNWAGVALYELGALKPAGQLFDAALRLDPELPHVRGNLDEIARRKAAGITRIPGLPPAVTAGLRTLETRAARVARAASPATGLTLSLCMIVKDEEAMLGRCLAAVRDAVDEIIVVDTGSTDRTVEIAESFGARILHHEWTGDFSAARNVSFGAATGDWVMYLDADEVLVDGDAAALRALTGRTWREAFYLVEVNHTGDLEDGTAVTHDALRVFRNRPEYRFEGRVHEQIAQHLPGFLPERLERTPVRMEHYGYLGVVRDAKGKSRRNIELLERQAAEGVDTPFLSFNLASEYAAAGQHERAYEHFARAWEEVVADPAVTTYGYAPSLAARFVKSLRVTGRLDRVDAVAEQVLEVFPGFTDVVYEQGFAARAREDLDAAASLFARCLEMGDAPSRYSATVGCGTSMAACALAEVHRMRGELPAAEALLRTALREHPGYLGTIEQLALVLLRQDVAAADVVDQLERDGGPLSPTAAFLVAVACFEVGAVQVAATLLRRTLAAQPEAHAARVILAEALLSEGDLPAAAQEAERVPTEAACADAAARTALFSRIAAGHDVSEEALDAAGRAGLPAHEVAVLRAWRDGGAPLPALPAEAAAPVLTMLDALARLEQYDAFEALAPVLDAVDVPWRERREALARLYLRRGYLESAADEWIAVVEREGPDARAYTGLAEVALARGLDEDADLLAAEARALEPAPA